MQKKEEEKKQTSFEEEYNEEKEGRFFNFRRKVNHKSTSYRIQFLKDKPFII